MTDAAARTYDRIQVSSLVAQNHQSNGVTILDVAVLTAGAFTGVFASAATAGATALIPTASAITTTRRLGLRPVMMSSLCLNVR